MDQTAELAGPPRAYPARNTLAQIRRDRLVASVPFYKALGGGWSLAGVEWRDERKAGGD